MAKSLLESSIAKREKDQKEKEEAEKNLQESECAQGSTGSRREPVEKAKEEAEKDLPKTECAQGSTSSKEEPRKEKKEEEEEEEEEKVDYDTVDLNKLRETVQRGVRPDRLPFEKLVDLEGRAGPKRSGSVYHQPTTTKRPGLIDTEQEKHDRSQPNINKRLNEKQKPLPGRRQRQRQPWRQ